LVAEEKRKNGCRRDLSVKPNTTFSLFDDDEKHKI
jgi:hypothetical protein